MKDSILYICYNDKLEMVNLKNIDDSRIIPGDRLSSLVIDKKYIFSYYRIIDYSKTDIASDKSYFKITTIN